MKPDELSLHELFSAECEAQCRILSDGLMVLESGGVAEEQLEVLMRAAHSLKGAARIVGYDQAVRISHALEDRFVAAQKAETVLTPAAVDRMLPAVDLLKQIGSEAQDDDSVFKSAADQCLQVLSQPDHTDASILKSPADLSPEPNPEENKKPSSVEEKKRMLRVSAENLNFLLGGAAESLVASRQLRHFTIQLQQLHRHQRQTARTLEAALDSAQINSHLVEALRTLQAQIEAGDRQILDNLTEADRIERRSTRLSQRLYSQALSCRMRPFSGITGGLRRAARDAARHTGRTIHTEFIGEGTDVDRDLLETLESPLGHLIRNAIEHGIEPPDERIASGKQPEGSLRVEASHTAGFLVIRISDDGRGINLDKLKKQIVERELAEAETVSNMDRSELLEFLFLPGFSLKSTVSEMSGRGVGLDVVRSLAAASRGTVRVQTEKGQGTVFTLQFPVSLSVMRVILFELAGEAYALPLARVESVVSCSASEIESVEGQQFFTHNGARIGLVDGAAVLEKNGATPSSGQVSVLILGEEERRFGIITSRFIGEGEVVIQPLDAHLGKVHNIAAAALSEEGNPVLLIDTDDFILSIQRYAKAGGRTTIAGPDLSVSSGKKRILIVEDSLTVRELERKIITSLGYSVDTAVDGADGWNAVRSGGYAAVVTDIDMPRMDGFELTTLIKNDSRLRETPVIIVSYKDRAEDRQRGLDVGADYYLTKGSFQDEGLVRALADVLGAEDII